MGSNLKISGLFVISFWALWHFAMLFDLAHNVSAFYPASALTIALISKYGPRFFPAVVFAVFFSSFPEEQFWEWGIANVHQVVRQVIIYGGLGWFFYSRKIQILRLDQQTIIPWLISTAVITSLLSALWAGVIFSYYNLVPQQFINSLIFGFWMGDLAGILLVLPLIAVLFTPNLRARLKTEFASCLQSFQPFFALLGFPVFIVAAIYFIVVGYGAHFITVVFTFLPIAVAGAMYGIIGSVVVVFICSIGLATLFSLTTFANLPLESMQAFLVAISSVGLMIGGLADRNDRSEKRFKQFANAASDWFWETDENDRFTYMSSGHFPATGVSHKALIGKSRTERTIEDLKSSKWQMYQRDLDNHRPYRDFVYELKRPDNTTMAVRINGLPIFTEDGHFCGYRGTATDITKLLNAERKHAEESDLRHKLLDVTEEGYWYISIDGITLDVNPAMCRMLSMKREDILGEKVETFVATRDAEFLKSQLENRRRGKKASYEIDLLRPDGTSLTCINNATPVTDEKGVVTGSVGMWSDITELKRSQHEISRMGRLVAVNEMGSSILHEINTPIQTASSTAYLGLMDYKNGKATLESMADNLRFIQDAMETVSQVEKRIRRFMNGEASKLEATDINQTINHSLELIGSEIRKHQTSLQLGLQEDLPYGMVDAVELEQVIINLIKNGFEAMTDLELEKRLISIRSEAIEKQKIRITVTDNGGGIPEALKGKIFEAFKTTKSGGTGMGLSICRNIMEGFGGSIEVKSDGQTGSSFILQLPMAEKKA